MKAEHIIGSDSEQLDAELQQCVELAAEETGAPMALVSLVLAHTQFFRAHHGLPADLALTRATDRDASFCQFVVRDRAPFEVNDATTDLRVPQDLVERYGIRAYLGVPVVTDDTVVGSLCVIDTKPRSFTSSERHALLQLSRRASAHIQRADDAKKATVASVVQVGSHPAFCEIRNILVPLTAGVAVASRHATELLPLAALLDHELTHEEAGRALGALRNTAHSIRVLAEQLADIQHAGDRLRKTFGALQAISDRENKGHLSEVVGAGLELAHHMTKLVGGVVAEDIPEMRLGCPIAFSASLLSSAAVALAALCGQHNGPILLTFKSKEDIAILNLRIRSDLDPSESEAAFAVITRQAECETGVSIETDPRGLSIVFPRSSRPEMTARSASSV